MQSFLHADNEDSDPTAWAVIVVRYVLSLHKAHMIEGAFSNVVAHIHRS